MEPASMTLWERISLAWFILTKARDYRLHRRKPEYDLSTYDWWKRPENMEDLHYLIACYARELWKEAGEPEDLDLPIWLGAETVVFCYLNT